MSSTPNLPERVTLASRGSKLALAQAERVASALRAVKPGIDVEILIVKTAGDKDLRPFAQIGGKGLFTSEVERALVEDRADLAVHSAKDLTAELAEGCVIGAVPERVAPHDIVIGGRGHSGEERLGGLAPGSRVGTSSMRRRAQLSEIRPDLEVVEFRGNLDTRLRKVADGEVDAAILAAAGVRRLPNAPAVDAGPLDPDRWVPAPAQGALAVEILGSRTDLVALCAAIDDVRARAEVELERSFAQRLEGGCSVPLGCLARSTEHGLVAQGYLATPDGSTVLRDRISGGSHEASALGRELADALLQGGGDDILEDLRAETFPEVVEP